MFRKNIKRFSALFLSLSLTLFVLAGCGENKGSDPSKTGKVENAENKDKESNKKDNNIDDASGDKNKPSNGDKKDGDTSQNKGDKNLDPSSKSSQTPSTLISAKLDGSFSINTSGLKIPVKFKDLKAIEGLKFGEVKKEMLPKSYEDVEGTLSFAEEGKTKTISIFTSLLNHGKENKASDDCNIYKLKFVASDKYEESDKNKEDKDNIAFGLAPEDLVKKIGEANDESENENGTIVYTYIRENKDGGEDKYTFKFKKNKNASKPSLSEMEMDISNLAERRASR